MKRKMWIEEGGTTMDDEYFDNLGERSDDEDETQELDFERENYEPDWEDEE